MYHMVRFLAQRFPVDLVAPALDGTDEVKRLLQSCCADMEFVPPSPGSLRRRLLRLGPYERDLALAQAIHRRLSGSQYGGVHLEKPAMLPYLPRDLRIPIVLDTFAYGLTGGLRALRHEPGPMVRVRNLLRLARFASFDAFCWPATHCILVVSEPDRQRCLRQRPGRKVLVVPNGVDCAAVRPGASRDKGPPILLFTGDMAFGPNVQAALCLATTIFPRVRQACPDAELHLVGRNPDPRVLALRGPGVVVTGAVPDMLPHLQAATVYLAPLTTGAGTRTKLLEALAAGLPIVTTRVGIEGIEAVNGQHVLIAEDAETTAAATRRLLADPEERRRLGDAGRRLAEDRYDWPRCLAPLEPLYRDLLHGSET
jgi:glycosyltransferase involved in cell wall biosynthesis